MRRIHNIFLRKEARAFLLFLGFVLILTLGAYEIASLLRSDLERITTDEIIKERILVKQAVSLRERHRLIRDIALAKDPFERDDLITEHAAYVHEFMTLRRQLLEMELAPAERKVYKNQTNNTASYLAQLDFIDRLVADEIEDPGNEILTRLQPILQVVDDQLAEQRMSVINASDELRKNTRERYEEGWIWVLVLYTFTLLVTGVLTYWIYHRQKAHQVALEYQATHDTLTGLSNRVEFERQLESALEGVHNYDARNVVLYMDLDQFKVVNDTGGHVAGDELLKDIVLQMRCCIRGSDLLARLGGDEFGVLLWGCDRDKAEEVAENIRKTIADYRFSWSGSEFAVGISIGLVVLSESFSDTTEVMSAVDVACYTAKDLGRDRVHSYGDDDVESTRRHGELYRVSQIRKALSQNQFGLHYQIIHPVHDYDAPKKVEILLRMKEDGRLVAPDDFIPAAERFNLMPLVDRWVIRRVLDMLSDSDQRCLANADIICINISGTSIADPLFLDFLIEALDNCDLGERQLCFEITESAAISRLTPAVKFMNKLRAKGCSFALDDFGKGLSSYNYLKQLPVDYLKIDGGFVRDMQPGSPDYVFVQSINTIGQALGLKTIAEWVETPETLTLLQELGVDYAQGWYLSDVIPCAECDAQLSLPGE